MSAALHGSGVLRELRARRAYPLDAMKKISLFLVLVALAAMSACAFTTEETAAPDPVVSDFDIDQEDAAPPASEVADVVEQVLPSVVHVRVRGVRLDQFGAQNVSGQGSGVIIDSEGIIVTNFHVVSGALKVKVEFTDEEREPVEGTVIGTAPDHDLAVIKVPEDDLTPITFGRSSNLRLGDSAIAVGFPLGLGGPTVTTGIISGEARDISVPGDDGEANKLKDLLQTDAAINPGNSGGALVDGTGRLIGINTAAANAATAENIGFAISIDSALPVIERIVSEPVEERAWLGVIIETLDPNVALELGLDPNLKGALITDLVPGGPAEEEGIEAGDIITAVGDIAIESGEDLTEALTGLEPGDEVAVEVVTPEGADTVTLTLGLRPITFER